MKRLNYGENPSFAEINTCHREYAMYLTSIRDVLPQNVFDFAASDWHYNPDDKRCLHDSTLLSFKIEEIENLAAGKTETEIAIRLLGSCKTQINEIIYKDVRYYSLEKTQLTGVLADVLDEPTTYHGEWIIDEIYLADESLIVHEIEFSFNVNWKIYFKDFEYQILST